MLRDVRGCKNVKGDGKTGIWVNQNRDANAAYGFWKQKRERKQKRRLKEGYVHKKIRFYFEKDGFIHLWKK